MAPIEGFWGTPTATLDWCEDNYAVFPYIAEFWNTITNLSMIIPPLWGIYDARKQGFERRFAILYLLLLLTGFGSWMFHMTLLYEMQLLDEIPMVWGTAFMLYCLYRVRQNENYGVVMGLLLYCIAFTTVYLIFKNPLFHETMYGVLVFTMISLDLHLNMTQYSPGGLRMFLLGLLLYLFGFVLWNMDNLYCAQLRSIRSSMSPSVQPLTQLHGWWHIFAGYATYLHILSCIHHRQRYLKDECNFEYSWIGIGLRKEGTLKKE